MIIGRTINGRFTMIRPVLERSISGKLGCLKTLRDDHAIQSKPQRTNFVLFPLLLQWYQQKVYTLLFIHWRPTAPKSRLLVSMFKCPFSSFRNAL